MVLQRYKLLKQQGPAPKAGSSGVLRTDSRLVAPGDVFLAYRGVSSDGHVHVAQAVQQGASLVIVEDAAAVPKTGSNALAVPWLAVTNGRAAWAYLAAEAFGNPQEKLQILGVTGTNGKSSTVWMIGQLLQAAGVGCLSLGTIGAYFGAEFVPTRHTTPDPDALFGFFASAVASGIKVAAMEVSSHAIAQAKVLPLRFAGTSFTSFSRDHLDFHGTMAEYYETKWRLFTELALPDARQVFWDGLAVPPELEQVRGERVVYGYGAEAQAAAWRADDFLALQVEAMSFAGTKLQLKTKDRLTTGTVPYFARHAVENFAAALLLAEHAAGRPLSPSAWGQMRPVPGRLEQVYGANHGGEAREQPQIVVDYAHTPDALEKTLAVLRPLCKGHLAVVFGCGGDRDRGKRPLMGAVAVQLADRVYVTSDNPRTEDPAAIVADIIAGTGSATSTLVAEVDREQAIARAIADATPDDMVLLAGKGHETYQIIGKQQLTFDDRDIARKYLRGGV